MASVTFNHDGDPIYTAPNGMVYIAGGDNVNCTLPACPVELSVYGYRASLPFSATLIALYGLNIIAQSYLGWRYKSYGFMAATITGCLVEILGYAGRIMMWDNPWGQSGFIMQIGSLEQLTTFWLGHLKLTCKVLITIGPVFFSAAIYVMLYQM